MLRGGAALAVLLFHLWLYATPAPPARPNGLLDAAWSSGRLGLVLFFVLSGYLLYRPWTEARRRGSAPPALLPYLKRRAARILPGYYFALAGAFLLIPLIAGTPGVRLPPAEKLPYFIFFAQNLDSATIMKLDPPMWSLVVELCFYALLPLLGGLMLRTRLPDTVAWGCLLGGLLYSASIAGEGLSQPWSKALPALLPLFAVGMLAASLFSSEWWRMRRRGHLLLAGAGLILFNLIWHHHDQSQLALTVRDLPAAAGFALLLLALRGVEVRSRVWRGLGWVGTVSFGLYLWHVPVIWALRAGELLPLHPLAALPPVLLISLLFAHLSWIWVERPCIRRARKTSSLPLPACSGRLS